MCIHAYGCRILLKMLKKCKSDKMDSIINQIFNHINSLIYDKYGNYIIQYFIQYGNNFQKESIYEVIEHNVIQMSSEMYSSNVIEKYIM